MPLILILLLAVFQCSITNYLVTNPDYYQLGPYAWESSDFRAMKLGEAVTGSDGPDLDQITTLMVENDYDLTGLKDTRCGSRLLAAARPADYRKLKQTYETVLADLKYFPVPKSLKRDTPDVAYEDGWLEGRSYISGGQAGEENEAGEGRAGSDRAGEDRAGEDKTGENKVGETGSRRHEGCDIMGTKMPPGSYPVVSMTDGTVERMGWLEMGGWRVGIRAPHGAYVYYAHLYGYAEDLKEGDQVKAGDLLGYMGDTGYGKTEGTRGNFDVHLHVGLYIRTDHYEEMSVNPYWLLRYLESKRLVYIY